MNTSATGGILTPDPVGAPLYGDALVDLFQALFAGLSGLDGQFVRPAYQPTPPKQLPASVDWCAVAVLRFERDANPAVVHDPAGNGTDRMQRHEEIHTLVSFYGPNADGLAAQVADGLPLAQNNETLTAQLMTYVNTDTIRQVSELVNQLWIPRFDLPVRFRRKVQRTYAVQNLVSAGATIVRG